MRILAPIQKDDGCSFFRIETPAKYLNDWQIDMPQYSINKYYHPRSGSGLIDRVTGSLWDRRKLRERRGMVEQQDAYDAFWLSRSLLSFDNTADRDLRKIIYDVDDAVWLNGEGDHCFEHHCREAVVVLAGNSFIAENARRYSKKVEVVPTSVDTGYHRNLQLKSSIFNVGWIGSASGLKYLKTISGQLLSFFDKHQDARLVVVTERLTSDLMDLQKYVTYVPWSRDTEIGSINRFTVGIMPLANSDWERGKCSFKMLQYMACEKPAIVSPVGMNLEVLKYSGTAATDNWAEVLDHYYSMSEQDRLAVGRKGREIVEQYYSTKVITPVIDECFERYL